MKLIKSTEVNQHKNSDSCTALEYPLGDSDINIAVVTVNGQYPGTGKVINTKCKEIAFVLEGSGKVIVNDKEIILEKGDAILIEPNESIYWEGSLKMLMSCSPAWYPEQHEHLE